MPHTQDNSGSQSGLPIRLRGDNLMHQREEPIGVVLDLDVHVKLNMLILRLQKFSLDLKAQATTTKERETQENM